MDQRALHAMGRLGSQVGRHQIVDYFQSSRLARVMIVAQYQLRSIFRLCLKAPQRFWLNCLDALKDPHDLVVRFFGEVVSLFYSSSAARRLLTRFPSICLAFSRTGAERSAKVARDAITASPREGHQTQVRFPPSKSNRVGQRREPPRSRRDRTTPDTFRSQVFAYGIRSGQPGAIGEHRRGRACVHENAARVRRFDR
jgi:hypothetical protein